MKKKKGWLACVLLLLGTLATLISKKDKHKKQVVYKFSFHLQDKNTGTQELLAELGAAGKPTLYVFNKCDAGMACPPSAVINTEDEKYVCISAKSGEGVESLAELLEQILHHKDLFHNPKLNSCLGQNI